MINIDDIKGKCNLIIHSEIEAQGRDFVVTKGEAYFILSFIECAFSEQILINDLFETNDKQAEVIRNYRQRLAKYEDIENEAPFE